ncbi:MAG TPA: Gfo/Idh/MocA family oxidoreductase, partial [Novosphingobium sp.]|nr:Gfo/Idh/MocA family oxidoreductase [Novosphingobium sp.]
MNTARPLAVVIGTGFGTRVHVPALRSAGFDVVAIVGRNPDKTAHLAAKAGVEHGFVDAGAALDLKPQVVVVATPPHTHADLTRQAFAAGAHVVCEKPFTSTLEEAAELCAISAKTGLIGILCHEFRYMPSTALFGRLLESGAIGEPRITTLIAHCDIVADTAGSRSDWWFDKSKAGGWFGASGSHGIDRIQDWYGEIAGVGAQLRCAADRPATSADDSFTMQFLTRSGVTGTFDSTAAAWGPNFGLQRVSGTGGTMWIDDETGAGNLESLSGSVHIANKGGVRE